MVRLFFLLVNSGPDAGNFEIFVLIVSAKQCPHGRVVHMTGAAEFKKK